MLRRSRVQPSPEEVERWRRQAELATPFASSALRGVIGVGASVVAGGLTVELIAIEVRGAGARASLNWRVNGDETDDGHRLMMIDEPDVAVTDDVGTRYEVVPQGSSSGVDRGEASFLFGPSLPALSRELRIVIERFRASPFMPGDRRSAPPGQSSSARGLSR